MTYRLAWYGIVIAPGVLFGAGIALLWWALQ